MGRREAREGMRMDAKLVFEGMDKKGMVAVEAEEKRLKCLLR